ncbi:hypothetical protein ACFQ1E_11135 [Sphingomonas canadensis]|uniref:Lipoprotein n=1 Tax=Sphingomonas canadensis TaxID=1219257 RepID=A0ABW3H9R1_9SPHN|nr:hypothetical protein [Sphingomonas canadensis]MCW3836326.1 hypothetical protein [Sphingomonas canadensis]
MMRVSYRTALIAVTVLLAGCGGSKTRTVTGEDDQRVDVTTTAGGETKVTTTGADGSKGSYSTGGAWPKDAPEYAAAYPGAAVSGSFSGTSDGGSGSTVTFTTGDPPDKLVAFYRQRVEAAGMKQVSSFDAQGTQMTAWLDEPNGRQFSLQTTSAEGRTTATLIYGTKAP